MSQENEIRGYAYVNRPYESVSDVLQNDAVGLFHRATQSAAARAGSLASTLKLDVGGFEIGKNIVIDVKRIEARADIPTKVAAEATRLAIEWRAESHASLFPAMRAELTIYPLLADETQIDLHGFYTPPGGALGQAGNWLFGHRIAKATLHRFLEDLCQGIRTDIRNESNPRQEKARRPEGSL